jgi:hypothetical protein
MAKPTPQDTRKQDLRKLADELRQLRKGVTLSKIPIRELINEGRPY